MFYEFNQNNSGGFFDFDKDAGITHHVIIEANNAREAELRAEMIGLYFDGCDYGRDCECCGDRWYRPWGEGTEAPEIYGKSPKEFVKDSIYVWVEEGHEVCVHYLDGRKEWW